MKRKDETNEEKDTDDLGSTGDESEDGHSSNTHNDQDSDVSFENDTDEEIDITVIEEEDWIEYVNNCVHPLVVLVWCVFGTCRASVVPAEVLYTWCPHVGFSRAPVFVCPKGP